MIINWVASLVDWKPSEGAQEIGEDDPRFEVLIAFLELFGNQELLDIDVSYANWQKTFFDIKKCGFNNNALASVAAAQLREHRKLWETHLDQPDNVAFEFPMVVTVSDMLYYFKLIVSLPECKEFNKESFVLLREIKISFHENKHHVRRGV